jgi:hypothetical protein
MFLEKITLNRKFWNSAKGRADNFLRQFRNLVVSPGLKEQIHGAVNW